MKGSPFTTLCEKLADSSDAKIDLHTHTTASDGDSTPASLLRLALLKGLKILAITDHDTTRGYELAATLPAGSIQIVPGVEITTIFQGRETHLLGYFVDVNNHCLQQLLSRNRDRRRDRFHARTKILQQSGNRIDGAAIDDDPVRSLGRRHLARHLVQTGQADSLTKAFHKHLKLSETEHASLPSMEVPIEEAIAAIDKAGGLTSLAHPSSTIEIEAIQTLKSFGLDALEVEYPWPKQSHGRKLREWADRLELSVTGGSDFHGDDQKMQLLGRRGLSAADWQRLCRVGSRFGEPTGGA